MLDHFRYFACLLYLLQSLPAMAEPVTLSAEWDGSEPVTAPFPGTCAGAGDLGYRQFEALQVSAAGQYHLADASDSLPGNLVAALYAGAFDPADPA